MKGAGTVIVVGTGLAGLRTAETLRAEGFEGRVILVGEENHLPYERPALSKELLAGKRSAEQVLLRKLEFYEQEQIELVLGRRVERIDAERRLAFLDDGRELHWDALVIATGSRARQLRGIETPAGVLHLRTLADSLALSRELVPGKRLAVIGAGFIGVEVASTAVSLGLGVTIVEPAPAPLERVLGNEVGTLLAERYRAKGVDVRLGVGVDGFRTGEDGYVRAIRLADGTEVACDVAVVGIGAEPAGELLGSGEIATDASGRTNLPDVYACGDVASSWRPSLRQRVRVEHWTNAAGQAAAVARTILGQESVHDDVPFFWSDQFGLRIQHVGFASEWARVEIEEGTDAFSARYLDRDGRLLAALAANRPGDIAALRRELKENAHSSAERLSSSERRPALALA